jgi:anti-sigma-K factor RskA
VTLTKGKTTAVPQGRATYVASKGALIFTASNLEPLQPGKTYELWLIPAAAGESPIPAGTFRPDERGNASVIMPPLTKGVEAKAFGVTVEDEGGATVPTLPIILAGE